MFFEDDGFSSAPLLDRLLDQPHASTDVFQACEKDFGDGRRIALAEKNSVRDLLFFQKFFHISYKRPRDDLLAPQHPQPFQEYTQCNHRAENDWVNEYTAFENKIDHTTVSIY
jgi:hypothetical protein